MTNRSTKKSSKGSPAELNCYKIAQVDGEVLLMKKKKNSRGGTHQVGSEIHTRSVCREVGLETGEERKFFK